MNESKNTRQNKLKRFKTKRGKKLVNNIRKKLTMKEWEDSESMNEWMGKIPNQWIEKKKIRMNVWEKFRINETKKSDWIKKKIEN